MLPLVKKGTAGALLFFGVLALWPGSRSDDEGAAQVVDAATIVIDGRTHRLFGVVGPSLDQTCRDRSCGREAADALRRKIGGRKVRCEIQMEEAGEKVSICRVEGDALNAWLVRQGWAQACRWGRLDYSTEEDTAKFLRAGLWAGSFAPLPEDGKCPARRSDAQPSH